MDIAKYTTEIFKIKTDAEFERLALQAFVHQKQNCPVYREYLQLIGKENFIPKHASEIPFLPIKLFKSRQIICKAPSSAVTSNVTSNVTSTVTSTVTYAVTPTVASTVASKYLPANDLRIVKKNDSHSCPHATDNSDLHGCLHAADNNDLHGCLHAADNTVVFTSSATTGMIPSKHYVSDIKIYEKDFIKSFEHFYGNIKNYNLLALLPSYLERKGSSLVYMADKMIKRVKAAGGEGGFYLYNHEQLLKDLTRLCSGATACSKNSYCPKSNHLKSNHLKSKAAQTGKNNKERKTILLGVSFALLDFAKFLKAKKSDLGADLKKSQKDNISKNHNILSFENLIVMETGGMKGHGKELNRNELHAALSQGFGFPTKACGTSPIHSASPIHSEYGMAELLSQAYSTGNGIFQTPPWMRVFTRDLMDPFKITSAASSGSSGSTASAASSASSASAASSAGAAKYSGSANRACTAVSGGINIIDLANINSCCFIETEDRGTVTTCNTHSISRKASSCTKTHSIETTRTETNRTETNCTEINRTETNRTETNRTETNCTKTNCTETNRT